MVGLILLASFLALFVWGLTYFFFRNLGIDVSRTYALTNVAVLILLCVTALNVIGFQIMYSWHIQRMLDYTPPVHQTTRDYFPNHMW